MASNSAIWRATSLGPEADNSSDIIEFNDLTLNVPHGITQSQTTLTTAIGVNPKPKEKLDELQDTGFSSATVVITGSIRNPHLEYPSINQAHILKRWMIEDKTNSSFPYGKFGLRMDDFPVFDLTPTSTLGYIISDVIFVRDGEIKDKLNVVITLRLNGDVGSSTNGEYNW